LKIESSHNRIFLYTNKVNGCYGTKNDITDQAIHAVMQYMLDTGQTKIISPLGTLIMEKNDVE